MARAQNLFTYSHLIFSRHGRFFDRFAFTPERPEYGHGTFFFENGAAELCVLRRVCA